MSASSFDFQSRDRKKSAHWTDGDTEVLITCLLTHKDTSRTADHGFKVEVWREIAARLEEQNYMGGPKTAEACKSRWQRLQRDFKAAKDMQAYPGIAWDSTQHRLVGAESAWQAAKQHTDAYKYQKVHLPCYDSLSVLCPIDQNQRQSRHRGRPSLASTSISDSSSMLDLSIGSSQNQHQPTLVSAMAQVNGLPSDHEPSIHAEQQHLPPNGNLDEHGVTGNGVPDGMSWQTMSNGGEGNYGMPFATINGASNPYPVSIPRIPFDATTLVGSTAPPELHPAFEASRPSPSKKARTIGPPPHQIPPLPPHHLPLHHGYPSNMQQDSPTTQRHNRSVDYPTSAPTTLMTTQIMLSPTTPMSAVPLQLLSQPQSRTSSPRQRLKPVVPQHGSTYRAEMPGSAPFSESHRRTEALLRLQSMETDMPDEDLVEIMAEFESNLAAADTYLAIQRESVRKLYLAKLLTRIKRDGG